MSTSVTLPIFVGLAFALVDIATAAVPCETDFECEKTLRKGSQCVEGVCDNPFARGGCLKQLLPNWHDIRVCGSDDPAEAVDRGECRLPQAGLQYTEIRIHSQNWESAFFQAWILQIILSEILHVPVSIETGKPDKRLDFYDHGMPFDYGAGYDLDALRSAQVLGDCRLRKLTNIADMGTPVEAIDDNSYISCCHVIPEVWDGPMLSVMQLERENIIEPPHGMGAIGQVRLFIPKFTGERDPTLFHFIGLQGEKNRRKLAEAFLRPTTWKDYCNLISPTKCQLPNITALRPPDDENEGERYFSDGLYTGYFRKTEQSDCDSHPNNCTGHIVDFPCGWSSYVFQQVIHLGIALESNGPEAGSRGYSYDQMVDIWAAANATKSNVMMLWWSPEALYQEYLGTDAEFQPVILPAPTQACNNARVDIRTRCEGTLEERIGNAQGMCDYSPIPLLRLFTRNLYMLSRSMELESAQQSPAYDTIKAFTFSGLQIGTIFDRWRQRGQDKWNYDPRDAVCGWVVDNIEQIQTLIPRTFPRVVQNATNRSQNALAVSATAVSCFAICLVVICITFTYRFRKTRCMIYAQTEFAAFLLIGLLMVSLGAGILAIPPTDATCTATIWLTNMGYTLELVPLVVKMAAINQIMNAARKMRRVTLSRRSLFGVVVVLSMIVVVFLMFWTILDRPIQATSYQLTQKKNEQDETIVTATAFCQSSFDAWSYMSITWHSLLLVCATVLAFQTRKIQHDVNETQTLAFMIYSHFVFVMLRVIVFSLAGTLEVSRTPMYFSLVFSIDVVATCFIYFIPKFVKRDESSRGRTAYIGEASLYQARPCNVSELPVSSGHRSYTTLKHGTKPAAGSDCSSSPIHNEDTPSFKLHEKFSMSNDDTSEIESMKRDKAESSPVMKAAESIPMLDFTI